MSPSAYVAYGMAVGVMCALSGYLFGRARSQAIASIKASGVIQNDLEPSSDALKEIYREKNLNFRHFDTLRWSVHTVVMAAAGLGATYAAQTKAALSDRSIMFLLLLFGVFAELCWWLLYRLAHNHMKNSLALAIVANRLGDLSVPPIPSGLTSTLSSAAFLFMAFVGSLGGIAVATVFLRWFGIL